MNVRDSLQEAYAQAINNLDYKLDSSQITADSLQLQLTLKVNEINRLRREIGGILRNRNASTEELGLAKTKMTELENRVEELRVQNSTMEEEKQMLSNTLQKLSDEMKFLEQNIRTLGDENKVLTEKIGQVPKRIIPGRSNSIMKRVNRRNSSFRWMWQAFKKVPTTWRSGTVA
jgi:chromosome segregation ATPase